MKKIIVLSLWTPLLITCTTLKFLPPTTIDNAHAPPGTIQLAHNLYIDQNEVTNLLYLEFMHWTERVYGKDSPQLLDISPQITGWSQLGGDYGMLDVYYLGHPGFRDFPVVDISYEQAVAFSKWRSDRVMELMLIRANVFPYKFSQHKDSVFTIERYFNGEYYGIQPDPRYFIYPKYSLPDSLTYLQAEVFADSLNSMNYKHCRKKSYPLKKPVDNHCREEATNSTPSLSNLTCPTTRVYYSDCKKDLVTHLKGNVRELTSTKGLFYGGSFMDSCSATNTTFRRDTLFVNSFTGFRNMCEYCQWKN